MAVLLSRWVALLVREMTRSSMPDGAPDNVPVRDFHSAGPIGTATRSVQA